MIYYDKMVNQQEGLPYPDPEARLRQVHTVQVLNVSIISFLYYDQFQITWSEVLDLSIIPFSRIMIDFKLP